MEEWATAYFILNGKEWFKMALRKDGIKIEWNRKTINWKDDVEIEWNLISTKTKFH